MTTKHNTIDPTFAVGHTLRWADYIGKLIENDEDKLIEVIVRRIYSGLGDVHDGYIAEKVGKLKNHGICYLFHGLDNSNMLTVVELFTTWTVSEFLADYYAPKHEELVELGYSPEDAAGIIESQKENDNDN